MRSIFLIAILAIVGGTLPGSTVAQEFYGGTVLYQKTVKYGFESVYGGGISDPRKQQWLESLPKEGKQVGVLYFTKNIARYEGDSSEQEAQSPSLQWAIQGAFKRRPPKPELKQVYYDFEAKRKTEQVGFMMRDFLMEAEIDRQAWKLTNRVVKVHGYTCMAAERKEGEKSVTAWFTSEIPVHVGPDRYFGLPGLILVVEVDGETVYMATSVTLARPEDDSLAELEDGKKISEREFDIIVEEKVLEFNEIMRSRKGNDSGK
jgi:GLPGLI family protein